jgi:sugar phosphate isomerase/epimerase
MYKNLCPEALGITGRQSELIELAMTYGFEGLDVDFPQFAKQVGLRGLDHAARFLRSSHLKIGALNLPICWDGEDDVFKQALMELPKLVETALTIGARDFYLTVRPASHTRPFKTNFEFHQKRISEVAERLASDDLRVGVSFLAPLYHRKGYEYSFISSPDALLTLMKTTAVTNLAMLVDLWHWRVGGGTIEQLRELAPRQIVMVRVADIPDDISMETITEEDRLLPGTTGVVDSVAALRVLREIGYDGPVTPYPHPHQLKGQTRDRIVQRAKESLESALKASRLEKTASLSAVGTL